MELADIVIKFGNFYSEVDSSGLFSFLKQILGSLIGAGVSLFLFYKKQKSDKDELERKIKLENEKKENEKKDNENFWVDYVVSLTNSIKEDIETEIKLLKEFEERIEKYPYSVTFKKFKPSNNFQRFTEKLNQKELHVVLISSKKKIDSKEFNSLYNCVDFFDAYMKRSIKNWELFRDIQTANQIGFTDSQRKIISELHILKDEYKILVPKSPVSENNSKIIDDVLKSNKDFKPQNTNENEDNVANEFESIGNNLTAIYESQIKPLDALVITTNTPIEPLNKRFDFIDRITNAHRFYRKLKMQSSIQIINTRNSVNDLSEKLKHYNIVLEKLNRINEN
jgi:hypothetical protein